MVARASACRVGGTRRSSSVRSNIKRLNPPRAPAVNANTTLMPKGKAAQVLATLHISWADLKEAGPNPNRALDDVFCDQCDQSSHKLDPQILPGMPRWFSWYRSS